SAHPGEAPNAVIHMHDVIAILQIGIAGFRHAAVLRNLAAARLRAAPAENFVIGQQVGHTLLGAQSPSLLQRPVDKPQRTGWWSFRDIFLGGDETILLVPQFAQARGL